MSVAADFRLYSSNALDVLAGLLSEELREPAAGAGLLEPDTILIPQASMRRWLQKTLAERHGIAANLRFLAPGEFVGEVLAANLAIHEDATTLEPQRLRWRLYACMRDPALLAQPAFAGALRSYLSTSDAELNAWSLSLELAEAFGKYQAWRRDWLLRWDRGADPTDWQALLWREATRGNNHRAQAIDTFLRRHADRDAPLPRGLPPRVFAFACINISPDVLHVLATAARAATVHFYLPMPTRKYWGDLIAVRERLQADEADPFDSSENPLLSAWGRAGRDFVATLFSYAMVEPLEFEAYARPDPARGLLQQLQADVFERRAADGAKRALTTIAHDRSLQVHSCHTRLREVQVLHDQLRALLEDDPTLEVRDIAVMAPDIDAYAPFVVAVFGGALGSARFIPYTLADTSALAVSPLADLFLRLLELPQARLTSNEVMDLLALPAVQRRFELDGDDLVNVRYWIAAAGARWGLDAAHRVRLGAPRENAYTWRFALDRLLLGHAAGTDADIEGIAPWPHLEGGALVALDALIRLLAQLEHALREFAHPRTAAEWQQRLASLLTQLIGPPSNDAAEQRAFDGLLAEIDAFRSNAESADPLRTIPPEIVRAHFRACLGAVDARQPFLAGGVTFCRMVPMRLIPFDVICLLGLNDGDYPRREPPSSLNRLAAALDTPQRRRGDRSVRDDDRFLFLQLLTAAERVFYLSYIGHDATDGSAREPSVLVSELLDAAADHFAETERARAGLVVRHPLQPFGRLTRDDARRVTFDATWQPALEESLQLRTQRPFADAPLPLPAQAARVEYRALRAFLSNPQRRFLRERLQVRLPELDAQLADTEPYADEDAIERSALRRRVLAALLSDEAADESALCRRLQAEAWLPPSAAGEQQLRALLRELDPLARTIAYTRSGAPQAQPFALDLDGVILAGALDDVDDASALRVKPGKPSGRDWVRWHLDALVLDALGDTRPLAAFASFSPHDWGPRRLQKHSAGAASAALRWLVELMRIGESVPLPMGPRSAWAWLEGLDGNNPAQHSERALDAAEDVWTGRDGNGEGSDAWTALALRGADPFADAAARARFGMLAQAVTGALRDAQVPAWRAEFFARGADSDQAAVP